jgi:hypothetical protein
VLDLVLDVHDLAQGALVEHLADAFARAVRT